MARGTHKGMPKRSSRPRDVNQLAKLIADMPTGNVPSETKADDGKNPAAVALGRLGGAKGGAARAKALTAEQRAKIASVAAQARWKKSDR